MSSTTIAAGAALAITGHAFLDPEEQQPARLPSAGRQTKVPPSSPQMSAPNYVERLGAPPLARPLTFFD
jgi:hypothetical protein